MPFNVKRRGKVTYYYEGDRPVLSALVSEEQPDGDLKIYFSGLTGAHSAKNVLGLDELATMDPLRELPLVSVAGGSGCAMLASANRSRTSIFWRCMPSPANR